VVGEVKATPGTQVEALERELARRAHLERDLQEQLGVQAKKGAEVERLFRLLVANVRDYAIFMLDPAGYITTWNVGAERIKGYTVSEAVGLHFSVFYPEADVRAGKCDMELRIAVREGRFEDEDWRLRKDGSRFWANVIITAVRDEAGELVGFAKVTRDLTDRKRNEDERAARLAAEHANRTKDEFLATLGHELRNPLAPIVTAIQLAKLHTDRHPTRELQVIERQIQQLTHLVDDLLDVSRIAQGKLELHKQVTDVRDPIARAIEIASPLIEQKHHHFELKIASHKILVEGDGPRLTQVFTNLIYNAAKYTQPGGHIFVLVWQTAHEVVIEVRDDGIGIDKELLASIFEPFVQGQQRLDRAGGGLGLGLPLVRSLVELHGGKVEARSQGPMLGSVFTVYLPAVSLGASQEVEGQLSAVFRPTPDRIRILLVDDNDDARTLLADILGELGHEVGVAPTGPAALEVVRGFTPDVAILDIGLPEMDGYELATRLRRTVPGVHLIAVSGYGQRTDRARSEAAGFERHLVKPVEVRRLLEAISEVSRQPAEKLGAKPPVDEPSTEPHDAEPTNDRARRSDRG
jgi:PAS domain S-box-containing protein